MSKMGVVISIAGTFIVGAIVGASFRDYLETATWGSVGDVKVRELQDYYSLVRDESDGLASSDETKSRVHNRIAHALIGVAHSYDAVKLSENREAISRIVSELEATGLLHSLEFADVRQLAELSLSCLATKSGDASECLDEGNSEMFRRHAAGSDGSLPSGT